MNIFYLVLLTLGILLSSYLIGSISWATIIAKYFYHIDIHKFGSGNAGGTNLGRACGKKAAYICILLDVFKVVIAVWSWFFILELTPLKDFIYSINEHLSLGLFYYLGGIGAALGHCFPIFEHFKGGKCVSCYGGFCLCTNYMLAILGFSIFLIIFAIKKKVSLASILGVFIVLLFSITFSTIEYFIPGSTLWMYWFPSSVKLDPSFYFTFYIFVYTILVISLHHANIKRLINKTEPDTHYKK